MSPSSLTFNASSPCLVSAQRRPINTSPHLSLAGASYPTAASVSVHSCDTQVSRIVQREQPDLIEIGSPFVVTLIVLHANAARNVPQVGFCPTNVPRISTT